MIDTFLLRDQARALVDQQSQRQPVVGADVYTDRGEAYRALS